MLPLLVKTLIAEPKVGGCTSYVAVTNDAIAANTKKCIKTDKSLYFDTAGDVTAIGKKLDGTVIESATKPMVATCSDSNFCFYEIESTKELKLVEFDVKNTKPGDKTFLVLSDNYKGNLFATLKYKYYFEIINPKGATVNIDYTTSAYKNYIPTIPSKEKKVSLEIKNVQNEEFIYIPFTVKGDKGNLPNKVLEVEKYKFYSKEGNYEIKEIQLKPNVEGLGCDSYSLANDQEFNIGKDKKVCLATDKVIYFHSDENINLKGKYISRKITEDKPQSSDIEEVSKVLIASCSSSLGDDRNYCYYEITAEKDTKLQIFTFPLVYLDKGFNTQQHKLAAKSDFTSQMSFEYDTKEATKKDIRINYQLINPNGVNLKINDKLPENVNIAESKLDSNCVFIGPEPTENTKKVDTTISFTLTGKSSSIDFNELEAIDLKPMFFHTKSISKGLIVGITIGCIAFVVIVALGAWFYCKKKAKDNELKDFENNEQAVDTKEKHQHKQKKKEESSSSSKSSSGSF